MGNSTSGKQQDEFEQMVKKMKRQQYNQATNPSKITINPEQKYLSMMIEKLSLSSMPQELKNITCRVLHQKLSKQDLIKTVSIANVLKNNDFDVFASKSSIIQSKDPSQRKTNNVKFNFNKMNPHIKRKLTGQHRQSQIILEDYEKLLTEEEIEKQKEHQQNKLSQTRDNIAIAMRVLRHELRKEHHPFWRLNKIFADYVSTGFMDVLAEVKHIDKDNEKYQQLLRKLISEWCEYLQDGCLYPYKKWLIVFLELPSAKLSKTLQSMLLQEVFSINNGYLYHTIMMIIEQYKTEIQVDIDMLTSQSSNITPELFSIDSKLQIQGNFFISIFQMSELESIPKPDRILSQLELIKNNICKDIDQYHKLQKKGYFYEIDSDNILGIVNFILCRLPTKIHSIYKQMIFLRMVYGDGIYFTHGISSYMLSTICGSIEFLQSEQFLKLIKENPLKGKTPISPASGASGSDKSDDGGLKKQNPGVIEEEHNEKEGQLMGFKTKQRKLSDQSLTGSQRNPEKSNQKISSNGQIVEKLKSDYYCQDGDSLEQSNKKNEVQNNRNLNININNNNNSKQQQTGSSLQNLDFFQKKLKQKNASNNNNIINSCQVVKDTTAFDNSLLTKIDTDEASTLTMKSIEQENRTSY